MAPGLILRERSSVVVCTKSQRGALLSDRLTLVSPPSLVPGEGGVTLACPMLLGDASCADGKKDIGLPESLVPWRLLADTDLEIVILLIPTDGDVAILLRSGSVLSKTLFSALVGNSKLGSVRISPE